MGDLTQYAVTVMDVYGDCSRRHDALTTYVKR